MNAVTESAATTAEMPVPFVFTDAAADKVKQLIDEEGNPDLKLRVFVQGGRAALLRLPVWLHVRRGSQRGRHRDEQNGVQLLIDSMSYQCLVGAEIDYKDDLNGAQFVIRTRTRAPPAGAARRSRSEHTEDPIRFAGIKKRASCPVFAVRIGDAARAVRQAPRQRG